MIVAVGVVLSVHSCDNILLNADALLHHPPKKILGGPRIFERVKCLEQHSRIISDSKLPFKLYATISPNKSGDSTRHQHGHSRDYVSKQKQRERNIPWGADFVTSRHTQTKIQSAAAALNGDVSSPFSCALTILQTLLDTPATECNSANVVCALTLSAKAIGGNQNKANISSGIFEHALTETVDILQMLVDGNKLSPRQLCNAAWAIAKHFEHEKNSRGISRLILNVLDSIALRMIYHLEKIRGKWSKNDQNRKHVQPGELSMLLWAYAVTKPRNLPPGWERPRQFEQNRLDEKVNMKRKSKNKNRDDHLVKFVSVDAEASDDSQNESTQGKSVTNRLFDAAAIAFCRGEGAAAIQSSNHDNGSMLKNCTWNELSNVAWSFATRGAYGTKQSDAMLSFLAREATRRLRFASRAPAYLTGGRPNRYCQILPRDVTTIAWALGTKESDKISNENALVYLVDGIDEYWINNDSNERYRQIRCLKNADLVQLASALAHGRLDNISVLAAIYEECLRRFRRQKSQACLSAKEMSILLWVQARLNLTERNGVSFGEFPSAVCQTIADQVLMRNKEGESMLSKMQNIGLRSQEQANFAWSLTVLNKFDNHTTFILQNIFEAVSSQPAGNVQLEHAHQLWQAFYILREDCPDAVKFVQPELIHFLEKRWNIEKSRTKKSSYRHKAISKTLDLLGVAHRNEYKEDVDVAIALSDTSSFTSLAQMPFTELENAGVRHKIAVEFDGPHHFSVMATTGEELSQIENGNKIIPRVLGHTVLKYKMLKKKGWTVIRIPYYEWDKIPHWASMERQRYLQRCLKTHQEIQFSDMDISQYQALPKTRHSRFD